MKISLNWLKDLIEFDAPAEEIADKLTHSGLEVEGIEIFETIKGGLEGLVVGEVLTCQKHPDADKLSVTTVDIGEESPVQIVCGAPNVAAGQKVIVATIDTTLYPPEGEPFKIKKSKIRGQESFGMICAEDEIGLGTSHDGIMVLDTELPNGTPAAKYLNIESDQVLEIGLTPNRVDAASHFGVARELKALLKKNTKFPQLKDHTVGVKTNSIKVKIENTKACPRYCGIVLDNITVAPSPSWIQNRLKAIGLCPINNIVDITNYVLHELGQPLHAFDASKIEGNTVIVRNANDGNKFTTLDGAEYTLKADDLMIYNETDPMCIAGIFGGAKSGVSNSTTSIFLESAYFSADSVRKTGTRLGIKTDSSFRFERGTDPNMPLLALRRAANLICEIAGGLVVSDEIDIYPEKIEHFQFEVDIQRICKLIGKQIPEDEIKSILKSLEIEIKANNGTKLLLSVPPYRVDVTREADIVEEILRIYGYDNVEMDDFLGADSLALFPEKNIDSFKLAVASVLTGKGFFEIITNSLTKVQKPLLNDTQEAAHVHILNKLSEELGVMRQSLLYSGLEVIAHNLNRRQNDLKLFEFGKVYSKEGSDYKEKNYLSLFLTGNKTSESWVAKSEKTTLFDMIASVNNVLERLGFDEIQPTKRQEGIEYRRGPFVLAEVFHLKGKQLKSFDIKQDVFYAKIDVEQMLTMYSTKLVYSEIPKYPEVRRDLSLVVDKKTTFAEISAIAKKVNKKLIKEIDVFDVYEGENLGNDKKSYSVSFILQDENQTLTEGAIDTVMNKLIAEYETGLNALIRK